MFTAFAHSQDIEVSELLSKLGSFTDQFNATYDIAEVNDEITLIYIPGINNPFVKIYSKKKAAYTKENVIVVGGFKEIVNMMTSGNKKEHLQKALAIHYKKGSSILVDMKSEIEKLLPITGYSITVLSKKENKIISINDYGFDRVEFFKALKKFETNKD